MKENHVSSFRSSLGEILGTNEVSFKVFLNRFSPGVYPGLFWGGAGGSRDRKYQMPLPTHPTQGLLPSLHSCASDLYLAGWAHQVSVGFLLGSSAAAQGFCLRRAHIGPIAGSLPAWAPGAQPGAAKGPHWQKGEEDSQPMLSHHCSPTTIATCLPLASPFPSQSPTHPHSPTPLGHPCPHSPMPLSHTPLPGGREGATGG